MAMDVIAIALSKKYTDDSIAGTSGVLVGKNCTIDSITDITGGHRVTFKWTADDQTSKISTMDVMDGEDGSDGTSPTITVSEITGGHRLTITDADGTQTVDVMDGVKGDKGDAGEGVPEGGTTGQILKKKSNTDYDTEWVDAGGETASLDGLSDVNLGTPTDGQVLKYDATSGKWVNGTGGVVDVSMSDLDDVDLTSLADGDILVYVASTQKWTRSNALSNKVDKETGKSLIDLTTVVDGASYDSTNHLILFKHGSTTLFTLDAAAFVKDGMVDTVTITGGNLVITFNTDAGKQDISIPITDIFDPDNYYNKTATDTLLGAKADQTEVNSIENYYGSKNLCIYPFTHTTRTVNGITFTDNGDGTVTATGTATDNAIFQVSIRLESGELILPNGEYKVNGCPSGGSTNSYWMVMSRTSGGVAVNYGNDTGNGMTATLNGDDFSQDNVHFQIAIVIKSGYEITTPLVFKPMVRLATIKDGTFVPYAKTNRELTVDKAEQSEVTDILNIYGAKNLIPYPNDTTKITNGITFTDNGDGTVTADGTATADAFFASIHRTNSNVKYPVGKYYLSGCPSGGVFVNLYGWNELFQCFQSSHGFRK